jgi:hypothetical protein
MKKHIKSIHWIATALGAVLALLVILILLAPVLVNLESVKQKILTEFSQTIEGRLEVQRIDMHFFPRPSILFRGGSISVPEKTSGTFDSLSIYPEISMLLRGQVRIARIALESPDFQVSLPDDLGKMEGLEQFSLKAIDDGLASITAKVASQAPGLVVSIEKGSLTLLRQKNSAFWFRDIDTRVSLSGKRIGVEIRCNSSIWKHASLAGWLKPGDFQGEGRLQLTQLRPDLIVQNLFPLVEPRIEDSQVDLDLSFGADGVKLSHVELQSSVPSATLRKGEQTLTLKKVSLKGTFRQDGDKTITSLTELDSVYPQLTMSGNLSSDPASSQVSLELHAKEVDVESVRRTGLFLAGRLSFVQSILEILRKGRVPEMSLTSSGTTIRDLVTLENIRIQGSIIGGNIFIAEPRLDIEDVKGDALIARGIIEGRNLEARLGTAKGTKGLFRVDLKGEPEPFHLDISIDTDVASLPPFLRNVVEDESFLRELDFVRELRGDASGRLVLDRHAGGTQVSVDVNAFTLHAIYQRVPYPLDIRGKFLYDQPTARIVVENLSGKAGSSSFSQLTGQLSLEKEPKLGITSGAATIVLDEIYAWLLSVESMKAVLEGVDSAKGTLKLDALQVKGPLFQPRSWQFQVKGHVENVTVTSSRLPGPVQVKGGNFEAGPEQFSLSHFETRFRDSSVTVSGVLNHYLEEIDRADLSIQGEIGEESTLRISDLISLPHEFRIRSPFSLSQAHLLWEKSGKTALSGNWLVKHGPEVTIDALSERGDLVIKHLGIRDAKSNASLSFHLKRRELDLTFNGTLTGATLDELLERNEFITGWIKGNLSTHIALDQPFSSVAHGALQGADLSYPWTDEGPVQIDTFSLDAQDKVFTVNSNLVVSGHNLRIKGEVDFLLDGFVFDMDLFLNGLDLDHVMAKAAGQKGGGAFWSLPLRGLLKVESEYVKYGGFTWRPVHASIIFGPETISIGITRANLCAVDTLGVLEVSPNGLELRVKPKAKDQDLRETLICLWDVGGISGRFSFNGDASGKGKAETLSGSLRGTMEFEAKNGRYDRYGLLGKIFEVLSPTGILKIPDLRKEGFSYYTIRASGNLQGGKITIREALVDAPSTDLVFNGEIDLIDRKIDAVVLVVPFRTIDRIISYIPLVSYVMAGRLVAIPVRLSGDLDDPKVTPFSPSAVGAGLLDTVKRFFGLPFHVIQPLLPSESQK